MKILVDISVHSLDEGTRHLISDAASDEIAVVFPRSQEEIIRTGGDAQVYYGYCCEETFQYLPRLKWIQSNSAGMDVQLYPALKNSDVVLTNVAGVYASHAAEHAFALLLALTREIKSAAVHHIQHEWRRPKQLIEIGGLTLGIVGMGGFGIHMAKRGRGFDMRVIAVDPYRRDKPDPVDELMPIDLLPDLMRRSDVVMIACPLTQETYHLINAENLSLMKPTAYLINVARGKIVDERALIEVLKAEKIAGAGLDVTEVEPLPKDSPLWDMHSVLLTPHTAGGSQHRSRRAAEFFCENLKRYINGEPLKNIVDKQLGF
jgi:phosphoglycerate dehydrogenase-like enzyme